MAFFDFKGKQVYYEAIGEGKPILILNGIMMSTASWGIFVEAFSKNNKLILVDFLDQGKSEKLEGLDYDQGLQSELILELLKELSMDKINIVGISYGGEVAQRFAIENPDIVERLLLFNTTSKTGPWLRDIGEGWNLSIDNPMNYYLTTIPVIYSPGFYEKNQQWMEGRKKILTAGPFNDKEFLKAMVRLTRSAENHDTEKELHKIKCPTLIVGGEEDYLTPLREQRILKDRIPNSELVILSGCGHASMYEKPSLFISLVLGFVNNV
ncbi:alpha/beta fold hydrolase [Alloiococcus sp. CFN-8]|uniref:alpha/beta fold hydrolase n=1 Tax=Alloiococcus sp. CFN-8 TaxID=3416081 RepID=UPI003CF18AEA